MVDVNQQCLLLLSYIAIEKFILSSEGAGMGVVWLSSHDIVIYLVFNIYNSHQTCLQYKACILPFLSTLREFICYSSSVFVFYYLNPQIRHHHQCFTQLCAYTDFYIYQFICFPFLPASQIFCLRSLSFSIMEISNRDFQISFTNICGW